MRRRSLLAAALSCALVAGLAPGASASQVTVVAPANFGSEVHVVAVGDIADDGGRQGATSRTTAAIGPELVLALGDNAYDSGTIEEYRTRWAPTWGRFDSIAWTVPGNHEYITPNAAGYREYFGITGNTWWAKRAGAWLIIGVDSQKPYNLTQQAFVRRALATNDGIPTVVVWHHPRYSSGEHGNNASVDQLWRIVSADKDVRIALWGHDHDYEHLAIPVAGRTTKLHAFVVGTGGTALRGFKAAPTPFTVKRIADRHGVLELRLTATRWTWAFVQTDGVRPERGWRDL